MLLNSGADYVRMLDEEFEKMCSLIRHGKLPDLEETFDQNSLNISINFQDRITGNSLLHIAAQNGNKRILKFLLRRGASVNIQNLNGQTPLHFAYGFGYQSLGEYLISKGADDSLKNKDGLTCYEGLTSADISFI
jgi:ankyrin repeat protein